MSKDVYEDLSELMTEVMALSHSTVQTAQEFEKSVTERWHHVADEHRLDMLEPLGDGVAEQMAEIESTLHTLSKLFVVFSVATVKAVLDLNQVLNSLAMARAKQAGLN